MKFENKIPISITIGGKDVNKIRISGEVVWQKEVEPVDADYFYVENTYSGNNTISVKQTLTGSPDSSLYTKTLQYSKDKTNWSTITLSSTTHNINLNQGERVYFRGNEGVFNYYANDGAIQAITNILGTQSHTIGGNINTLVNYITPNELTLTQGVFAGLFQNNTTITSAENLTLPPSSDGSLPTFAYYLMFSGCSALITSPSEIPATKQGHASCSKMFLDCTQLKTPPALKSTILRNYCFTSIFKNCTSLISAPELPALTLASNCYQSAFEGCTSLKVAPQLPATVLADYCYQALFKGCSALTTPPTVIPAKTAPYLSCHRMFNDCVSLQSAPELSPTTLGSGAYQYMFMGCSNLQTAPSELPAETLELNSYYDMFRGCSQLTTAPTIKAKTFAKNSCRGMFLSCSSLDNLTVYADDNSQNNCTYKWLNGVASTGTLYNNGSATYVTDSVNGIPTGWTEKKPINYFYVKNEYDGTNNVTFRAVRRPTETTIQQIEYSKDKINWTTETITANIVITIPLEKGEKVYFRNDNGYFSNNLTGTSAFRIKIRATQNHSIGGDITTLYNYSYKSGVTMPEGCFRYLFGCDLESLNSGNTFERNPNLIDASQLILSEKNLSTGCYAGMFMLTTGLINPPQTIDCQSVGVESCHRMFKSSGITTTPSISAKTIGTNGCTEMFMECNNITTMPTLSATSLGEYCFSYMFSNCDNLGGTITLPATTTAKNSYSGMFEYTAITGATIKAKTLKQNCMTTMFKNCSNLNEVTVYATATSPSNLMISGITSHWLEGVASTGTFRNLGSLTFETDNVSGVPTGWTVVTE